MNQGADGGQDSGDGSGDGPSCKPTCENLCKLKVDCGIIASADLPDCLARCQANPGDPVLKCLEVLVCAPARDCNAAKQCQVNPTSPDLIVASFSAKAAGNQIAFSARVCNQGTGASKPTQLHLYRNRPQTPTPGIKGDHITQVKALTVGQCANISYSTTGLAPGQYRTWAQVDALDTVPEISETNNVAGPAKVTIGGGKQPDLMITSMFGKTTSSQIYYSVQICNIGGAQSKATIVDVYYNRASAPPASVPGNLQVKLPALIPGSCTSGSAISQPLKPGKHASWAYVDRQNLVPETSESNNTYGPVNITIGGPGYPDIVFKSFTAKSTPGGQVYYSATICNVGKAPAGPFYIDLYYNMKSTPSPGQKGNKTGYLSYLGAGVCTSRGFSVKLAVGTHTSWIRADRTNMVMESSEYNNTFGPVKVTVGGGTLPNLRVTKLAALPPPPGGGPVTYQITVCNLGGAMANYSYVDLYYNRNSAPPAGLAGNQSLYVSPLVAGGCIVRTAAAKLYPGTYLSWAYVDRKNIVKESSDADNTYGPYKFTVPGGGKLPDLKVTKLVANSSPGGGQVTYQATICNHGAVSSSSSQVDLYYNRTSAPPPYLAGNQSLYVSPLIVGGCIVRVFTTKLNPGTYLSWATVDRNNYVKESAEYNNTFGPTKVTVSGGTQLPDLKVTKLSAVPSPNGSVLYAASVCNQGKAASGVTYLDLYYNRSTPPPAYSPGNMTTYVPGLSPGSCTTRVFSTKLSPGTYLSWVYVDRTNYVKEASETNNTYGPLKVTVSGSGPLPDLLVAKLTATPYPSGSLYYSAQICNQGKAPASGFYVDLYYNRPSAPPATLAGNKTTYVSYLAAGACTTRYILASLPAGTYYSWLYVDRNNSVKEASEGNNIHGPTKVVVGSTNQPNLKVTSINVYVYSAGVYYYVQVCNTGNAQSGSTTLELYYNRTTAPPAGLPGNKSTSVPALNAGACTGRYFTASLPAGTYQSWVFVDRNNNVSEANENDNIGGPKQVVVGGSGKPDLVITGLKPTVYPSGYTYYYAQICNTGTASSSATNLDLYYNRSTPPPPYVPGNKTTYVPAIAAKACTTRTLYVSLPSGTYKSWVRVDRSNAVSESNEGNNVFGPTTFTVSGANQKPDLKISSFKAAAAGSTGAVTYSGVICNQGKGPAGSFLVGIYFNRSTVPKFGDKPNVTASVGSLTPGACKSFLTGGNLPSGTFTSWALADPNNYVAETNEGNNAAGPQTVIVGNQALCAPICSYLINPCGLVQSSQYAWCVNACKNQQPSAIDCAYKQMQAKSCFGIVSCIGTTP